MTRIEMNGIKLELVNWEDKQLIEVYKELVSRNMKDYKIIWNSKIKFSKNKKDIQKRDYVYLEIENYSKTLSTWDKNLIEQVEVIDPDKNYNWFVHEEENSNFCYLMKVEEFNCSGCSLPKQYFNTQRFMLEHYFSLKLEQLEESKDKEIKRSELIKIFQETIEQLKYYTFEDNFPHKAEKLDQKVEKKAEELINNHGK